MRSKLLALGLLVCLLLVTGCSTPVNGALFSETSPVDEGVAETESPIIVAEDKGVGMANPASVYCEEQGGTLDIRDTDAGQHGVCVFPNGSECEEWAFFRGECNPDAPAPKLVFGWYGRVVTPPADQPFENYLMLSPKEAGNAGLTTSDPAVKVQLDALRDTDKLAHFWGALICEDTGFNKETEFGGCVLDVTRVRVDGPGDFFAPDPVEGWAGILVSLSSEPGSGGDDAFILEDPIFKVRYGLHTFDSAVAAQLDNLRDRDVRFYVWGELTCGVPDAGGCQIAVTRIEGGEDVAALPEETQSVSDWAGFIVGTPEGAQFDDYFEKEGYDDGQFGVESHDPTIQAKIAALRDSNQQVHIWGTLTEDVPDFNGTQIDVQRLEVEALAEVETITEPVEDWVGVVVSNPEGAQFDDYFQMMDQNGTRVGIAGFGEIGEQLVALRDTGTVIHVWGIIRRNVPDAYGSQVEVTRLEIE
ncbi:MAG: DUF333 domain-containing protein [Anaerolineae bacterium]